MVKNTSSTGGKPPDSDLGFISAEEMNVVLNPLERELLVQKTRVQYSLAVNFR